MSYLGRVAARAASAPSVRGLRPSIRSGSPLAEYDQRLHLLGDAAPPGVGVLPAESSRSLGDPNASAVAEPSGIGPGVGASMPTGGVVQRRAASPAGAPSASALAPLTAPAGAAIPPPPAVESAARPAPSYRAVPARGADARVVAESRAQASEVEPPARPRETSRVEPRHTPALEHRGEPVSFAPERRAVLTPATPREDSSSPSSRDSDSSQGRRPAPVPDSLGAFREALGKVEAWMRRPTPAEARAPLSSPPVVVEAASSPAPTAREEAQPSAPRLSIGRIDVEVVAPPPATPARREPRPRRVTGAPAASRMLGSQLAKLTFGTRQR